MVLRVSLVLAILLMGTSGKAEQFVVGVENIHYLPFYAVSNEGEYQGFARELLDRFAKDSGHVFIYRPLPVARLLSQLLNGQVDVKFPDHPSWRSSAKAGHAIHYSNAITHYVDGVAAPVHLNLEQLHRLSTLLGFTPEAYAPLIQQGQIHLQQQTDISQLVRFVLAGRAQAAYINIDVLKNYLSQSQQENALVFQKHLPYKQSSYHLSTIQAPELIQSFNDWQQSHLDWIQSLEKRYGLPTTDCSPESPDIRQMPSIDATLR